MIQDAVFYLFDILDRPLRALPLMTRWTQEDLRGSTNELALRVPADGQGDIINDQEIIFRGRRYIIGEVDYDKHENEIILTCEEAQAGLTRVNVPAFTLADTMLHEAMTKAIARSKWKVGDVYGTDLKFNAELENQSATYCLKFLENQSGGRLVFDSMQRIVHILPPDTTPKEVSFRYGRNVGNIKRTMQSPQATVLKPIGKDGLTIEQLTDGGKDYIENFSWYTGLGLTIEEARARFTKEEIWTDERYIYNTNLFRDAEQRLATLSQPQINYKIINPDPADHVFLGDWVYVQDEELGLAVSVVVSRVKRSNDPEEDELELDYLPPILGGQLVDQYTGDSDGKENETSFFLVKNQADFTAGSTEAALVVSDITVYSATAFEMGLTFVIEVTTAGLLEGWLTLGPDRIGPSIKQTVGVGWYTIGIPFILTGVPEGTKTLRFYLKMPTGAGKILKEQAEFFVKATGVYGGASNKRPDRNVVENLTIGELHIVPLTKHDILTEATTWLQTPWIFSPAENVTPYIEPVPFVSESNVVFLDPPSPEPPPVLPAVEKPREEFAIMANYPDYPEQPPQIDVDSFIDILHSTDEVFKVVTFGQRIFVFSTTGTAITVDAEAKTISSDGELRAVELNYKDKVYGLTYSWAERAGLLREWEVLRRLVAATREEFALMANYPHVEHLGTQAAVDNFIDVSHAGAPMFKVGVSTLDAIDYLDVFATDGTFISFDAATYRVESDGPLFRLYKETEYTADQDAGTGLYYFQFTTGIELTFTELFQNAPTETETITFISRAQTTTVSELSTGDANIFAQQFTTPADGSIYLRDLAIWFNPTDLGDVQLAIAPDLAGEPDLAALVTVGDRIAVNQSAMTKYIATAAADISLAAGSSYWILADARNAADPGAYAVGATSEDIPIAKFNRAGTWYSLNAKLAHEMTLVTKTAAAPAPGETIELVTFGYNNSPTLAQYVDENQTPIFALPFTPTADKFIRSLSFWASVVTGTEAKFIVIGSDASGNPDLTNSLFEGSVSVSGAAVTKYTATAPADIAVTGGVKYWLGVSVVGTTDGTKHALGETAEAGAPTMQFYMNGAWNASYPRPLAHEIELVTKTAADPTPTEPAGLTVTYTENYSLSYQSEMYKTIYYTADKPVYKGAWVPVTEGTTVVITRDPLTEAMRTIFTERQPATVAATETFNLEASKVLNSTLATTELTVPAGATHLFIFYTLSGENTTITVTEKTV